MYKLNVSRTQWAVGNGFFHSGSVGSGGNELSYVYDCGALSKTENQNALAREINEYTNRTTEIDVCFISHFDYDHVSGIERLADSASIKQFVIPYTPSSERLFAVARQIRSGILEDPLSIEGLETYLSLITDPELELTRLVGNDTNQDNEAVVVVGPVDQFADDTEADLGRELN